jgi:outer membrane lipoprotein-sorting protein
MSRFAMLVIFAAAVIRPDVALQADEIAGTIEARETDAEAILSEWLKAARECQSYDAKFTRWVYDPVFDDKEPVMHEGRLLYQRGGPSRFDISHGASLLWQGEEIIEFSWSTTGCRIEVPPDPAAAPNQFPDFGWHTSIARALTHCFADLRVMPGLLSTDQKQFRDDYEFQLTKSTPDKIVLTAQPKSRRHSSGFVHDRLDYAFKDGRPLPYAVRIKNGARTTTYQMHDPLINKPAPDTEKFLTPGPSGRNGIDLRSWPADFK